MSREPSLRERGRRYALRRVERVLPRTPAGDRWFAVLEFLAAHGRLPERRPKRYSDHLFSIRAGGRLDDPLRRFVTCKESVKTYIAAAVGERFNLATYRILRTPEEASSFRPERFPCVVKPTHAAGRFRICREPADAPPPETLLGWLADDFYRHGREGNYRGLRRQILVEEFFSADGKIPAPEYKVYCFGGRARFVQVETGRGTDAYRRTLHDCRSWNRLPAGVLSPPPPPPTQTDRGRSPAPPAQRRLLLELAERLAAPFDFLRVDLYATDTEVRVGELTNCPNRGCSPVHPPSAQFLLGRYFDEPADRSRRPTPERTGLPPFRRV